MRILFLITRQFHQLLQLKGLAAEGLDRGEIAKKAGIPPFALGKYQAQAKRFTRAQLMSGSRRLCEYGRTGEDRTDR